VIANYKFPIANLVVMPRVHLPFHLRNLAGVTGEVELEITGAVTQRSLLDALEARYPQLRGTIREHETLRRRAFIRFFACQQDVSNDDPDAPLPDAITSSAEPFLVIGALSGG
jgi:molybdopterin synthase sulfur carrier subunit